MGYQDYLNLSMDEVKIEPRHEIEVADDYDKKDAFNLASTGRRYDRQFFTMYQARLNELKTRVDKKAMQQWGNGTIKRDGKIITKVDKILNISSNQLCWVSGTVFVDLKNKLNIFNDVENGVDDVLPKIPKSYVSSEGEDTRIVMLEDESGRAILHGDEKLKDSLLVTGTIVAILGIELQAGIFEILDIIYPDMVPPRPIHAKSNSKIAIVSGLEISDATTNDFKIDLLKDFIQGHNNTNHDGGINSSSISHLIIAGNSMQENEQEVNDDYFTTNNYGTKNISKFNTESLKIFDKFINDIIATCNISIMPGNSDPTDICLPQQPLHRSFFVSGKNYVNNNIKSLTNPSWLEIDSIRLLGTSGQNIDDIMKYLTEDQLSDPEIVLNIMEKTLKWQNIAPTAPDTLYCYPFENYDPFTLVDETPKLYFVGNQPKYSCKTLTVGSSDVKLLTIPKFKQTGELILVDTNDLSTEVVKFEI